MQKYVVGIGRVRAEWRGFETEEIPNVVTAKKLPSRTVWRKGYRWREEGKCKWKKESGQRQPPNFCLPAYPSANLSSGPPAHRQGSK